MTDDQSATEQGDPGIRTLRRLSLWGLGSATALAGLVGLLGGDGRAGALVFTLILALTSSLIGLVGVWTLVRDDYRDAPISRARIAITIVGFAGATLFLAMLVGLANGASAA